MTTGKSSASGGVRRRGRRERSAFGDPLAAGAELAGAPPGFISLATLTVLSLKIMSLPSSPVSLTSAISSRSGASPKRRASTCIAFQATTGSPVVASTTFTLFTSAEPVYATAARSRPARYVNRPAVDTSPERSTTSALLAMYGWAGVSASWATVKVASTAVPSGLTVPLAVKRPPCVTRNAASNGIGFLPSLRSSRALTLMPVSSS